MRIGGRQRRVLNREVYAPSWSPGGNRIAFHAFGRDGGETHVFTASRAGRGLKRFTQLGGEEPVWSPDGRRLLFLRWETTLVSAPLGGGRTLPVAYGDYPERSGPSFGHADWQPLPRKRSG